MKVPTHPIYRSFIIINKELVIDLANKSTFIKIDRNIQNWGWYQNANTFRVFIHCLIEARITAGTWQGVPINRGEFPTSYEKIAHTLNLTVSEVRTAISHLKSTGEIATKNYSKFQVISIVNYGYYQDKSAGKSTGNQQSLNIQFTVKSQHLKNDKNDKNDKNERDTRAREKNAFGKFKNVFLTDEQLSELKTQFPTSYEEKINRLSEYMYQSGKNYQDHYLMILKWAQEDVKKENSSSFDIDEFFEAALNKSYEEMQK